MVISAYLKYLLLIPSCESSQGHIFLILHLLSNSVSCTLWILHSRHPKFCYILSDFDFFVVCLAGKSSCLNSNYKLSLGFLLKSQFISFIFWAMICLSHAYIICCTPKMRKNWINLRINVRVTSRQGLLSHFLATVDVTSSVFGVFRPKNLVFPLGI